MAFPLRPLPSYTPGSVASPAPTLQTATQVLTFTMSPSPTLTSTPEWTITPSITLTRTPIEPIDTQEPGEITAPILLYHHVMDFKGAGERYYVSPADFRAQMKALSAWGYQSLTISELEALILKGGARPSHPVVITFDDANLDVYQNAFPIMQEVGFKATLYVIANAMESDTNMTVEMIKEVANAGWEIGSHSMTHADLRSSEDLGKEICTSRETISKKADVDVTSFAYPFGLVNPHVIEMTRDCGYTSGAGLGIFNIHNKHTLFYLSRREVRGGKTIEDFASLLPWSIKPSLTPRPLSSP